MKETEIQELGAKLRGELITPGDASYETARKVLYPIGGAAARVGKGDTAFSFRDAKFAEVIVGVDPDPANSPRLVQWAWDYWLVLNPFSAGGSYINMMMDEGADNVKAACRDNYARLAQVKRKYDPANLFRVNQNIGPSDS